MPDALPDQINKPGFIVSIVEKFLDPRLSIILIVLALLLGIGSVWMTPREEEPQIVVPIADIYVNYPGASAEEVERLVATPLEKLLWQIDGVEYVYSVSRREMAVVTVRYYVGENREDSLIKLYNKINSNIDMAPKQISGWIIKPVEIDDVPIVNVALYSERHDDHDLRRVSEEVITRLETLPDISYSQIVGGRPLEVRVEPDMERLAGSNISPLEIFQKIKAADSSMDAGSFQSNGKEINLKSGPFLRNINDVRNLVIGVQNGRPIYLRDVAAIEAVPQEPTNYSRINFGNSADNKNIVNKSFPAVTIAISKKKGTNAVAVANSVVNKLNELKQNVIPDEIYYEVTRNYGETADRKVNDLISSLFLAIITVVGLIFFTMGWRESLVVALAVPVSFSLSLFVNYISGYTINRVTLFALILSLGLVVDDPITNVDNIQRHIRKGILKPRSASLEAVREVLPPVIMSTLAIIMSFLPMFFITGMMGPYMRPMAINVPLTVTFSTVCALTFVPWLAYNLLKNRNWSDKEISTAKEGGGIVDRIYRFVVNPFLNSKPKAYVMLLVMIALLLVSGSLAFFRKVPLKMLPFDNKNEIQLVIDMPEGTTLEKTDGVVREFERYLKSVPEITNYTSYIGTASPIDFNGMVRHYYFRQSPNTADIRINFIDKEKREMQSHAIGLRIRNDLSELADKYNANLKIVESPPGPPVISTLVAEVYGTESKTYEDLIESSKVISKHIATESGVVDIDDSTETPRQRVDFVLDKEKAALNGITTESVVESLRLALSGFEPGYVHYPYERQPLNISLRLPQSSRSCFKQLERISVKGNNGRLIQLAELGSFKMIDEDQPIYHKNLERVVYVFGEMAGRAPGEAIIDIQNYFDKNPLPAGITAKWDGEGEWEITLSVFRDLGIAFGIALLGIYILVVNETKSLTVPMIIMLAIPLTAIGIMPGFYLLNLLVNKPVGGFDNPVFFTATAMIGMIALGGIVVRSSIVLIEFITQELESGVGIKEAILRGGSIRFRPIVLTAGTTALGAWPITLDPIFSGLAWALIFGILASTVFSLLVVPVVYYLFYGNKKKSQDKIIQDENL